MTKTPFPDMMGFCKEMMGFAEGMMKNMPCPFFAGEPEKTKGGETAEPKTETKETEKEREHS